MSAPTTAARYVVIACAGAYGAMKLWWLLGGDLLKAQTPLPQDAQQNLVAGGALTTASHRITALLAAAAVLVALSLGTGRAGRRVERLLRIGAVLVGVLMIVRAVGGFGFGSSATPSCSQASYRSTIHGTQTMSRAGTCSSGRRTGCCSVWRG